MLTKEQQDEAIERFSLDEDDDQWESWLDSLDESTRDKVLRFVGDILLPVLDDPDKDDTRKPETPED